MKNRTAALLALVLLGGAFTGCKPKTTAEKIENKAEDAAHETKQGIERAGDRVKDATN